MDELYQIIDANIQFTINSPEFGFTAKPFDNITPQDLARVSGRLNRSFANISWRMTKLTDSILIDGRLITTYMRWIYRRDGDFFKCPSTVSIKD